MKVYQLRFRQYIPTTLEEAWNFFSSPFNLARITPSLGFVITSDLKPEQKMYPGILISYKVAPLVGIKLNWLTEITHVTDMKYFVDEQRFGPFSFWHHQHHFEETSEGIRMDDMITYAIPMGIVGQAVNRLIVQKRILDIFSTREKMITEIFGTQKKKPF